jgi:hypothetical protein
MPKEEGQHHLLLRKLPPALTVKARPVPPVRRRGRRGRRGHQEGPRRTGSGAEDKAFSFDLFDSQIGILLPEGSSARSEGRQETTSCFEFSKLLVTPLCQRKMIIFCSTVMRSIII